MNLLQDKNKKAIRGEYIRRLAVVAGMFLLFDFFVGIILIAPVYYRSGEQEKDLDFLLKNSENKIAEGGRAPAAAVINDINDKISILESRQKNAATKSAVLREISNERSDGVSLTEFVFDDKNGLSISGTSRRREDLLGFVDLLKANERFKKVDSPVANLLKSKDFDFNIQITYVQ